MAGARYCEHLRETPLAQYAPVMPRTRLLKSGIGFYFLRLFCLPNEILREIWRPVAPAQELVNSIVRNRITRAVRLIFHSPTLPRRILSSSSACPRPPRAPPPLFFLSLVRRRAPRPGTCRGSYARTRIFVITKRVRETRVSLYAAKFLPRRVT